MLRHKKIAFSTWSVFQSAQAHNSFVASIGGQPSETVELSDCIKNISIWAKHVALQLTMLLEKQQWMSVIA